MHKIMAVILVLLNGCYYQVEEQVGEEMKPNPQIKLSNEPESLYPTHRSATGILGERQRTNVGKSVVFGPTGAITAGSPGYSETKDGVDRIVAIEQWDIENITVGLSALQIEGFKANGPDAAMIQAVLTWEAGESMFGFNQDRPATNFAGMHVPPFDPKIYVDIGAGETFTLPGASSLTLGLRYLSSKNANFAAGNNPGPKFRVNIGYSYGNISTQEAPVRCTSLLRNINDQEAPYMNLPAAGGLWMNRPPFASRIFFTWQTYGTAFGAGSVEIDFLGSNGVPILKVTILANVNPIPVFDWPSGAVAIQIVNNTAGDLADFSAVNYLAL